MPKGSIVQVMETDFCQITRKLSVGKEDCDYACDCDFLARAMLLYMIAHNVYDLWLNAGKCKLHGANFFVARAIEIDT